MIRVDVELRGRHRYKAARWSEATVSLRPANRRPAGARPLAAIRGGFCPGPPAPGRTDALLLVAVGGAVFSPPGTFPPRPSRSRRWCPTIACRARPGPRGEPPEQPTGPCILLLAGPAGAQEVPRSLFPAPPPIAVPSPPRARRRPYRSAHPGRESGRADLGQSRPAGCGGRARRAAMDRMARRPTWRCCSAGCRAAITDPTLADCSAHCSLRQGRPPTFYATGICCASTGCWPWRSLGGARSPGPGTRGLAGPRSRHVGFGPGSPPTRSSLPVPWLAHRRGTEAPWPQARVVCAALARRCVGRSAGPRSARCPR